MQSKNKPGMTKAEREHVTRIKEMPCGVCSSSGPTEAHGQENLGLRLAANPRTRCYFPAHVQPLIAEVFDG